MEAKYLCPSCRNSINVDEDVVLVGKTRTGLKGLIFLHAAIGNYHVRFSTDFNLIAGNTVNFTCPICHHSMAYHKQKNKALIIRIEPDGKESMLVFSEIYGENCTYEVIGEELKELK